MIRATVSDRIPPRQVPRGGGEATVIRGRGAAAPGVLRPGTVLGHTYAIEELLGRGSLGEVYRAKHVELGTAHAIKLIQPALASDPKTVQLLIEEARKLARVHHDAVVNYEGLFRDEQGLRYLVMEYVDGPTLAEVISGRRFEADEVLILRDRLAEGLAAVHNRGIIHRDLSPDNVILPDGEVGRAKLIGFGFAKTGDAGDATMIGVNLMTRHAYASPEQLGLFGGRIDSRSDLYSLGLVLSAAAIGFGRTLEMGTSPGQAIVARQKAPDLTPVPAALRPVIAPLLMPQPDERPASVRMLLDGGGGGTAARGAPRAGVSTPGSRTAWLIGGGVAAALLLVGVIVWALLHTGSGGVATTDDVRARVAAAIATQDCSAVQYALAPDRSLKLTGHVASAADLARLRRDIAAIPSIAQPAIDVEIMGRPHCEVAAMLTPLTDTAQRDGLSLGFVGGKTEVFIGERPSFQVRAPGFDSYLYIDYFDSSGQVLHLFPNERDRFNLRPWRNRFVLFKSPLWTVCGTVGRQLISTLALAKPIDAAQRPDVEEAKDYVAAMRDAVGKARGGKMGASLLFFDLHEAPPWINRDLACPPGS